MTGIVLLSRAVDEHRVRPVAEALLENGLEFWWEQLPAEADGANAGVANARCVIVALTAAAAQDKSAFARAVAQAAADGRVVVARLDKGKLPGALTGKTAIDLTRFKRSADDLFLLDLVNAARAKAAGIDPPPPRGPITRFRIRAMAVASAVFVLLSTAIALRADIGVMLHEGLLPRIEQPTDAESAAWNGVPMGKPGSCEALRKVHGFYANQAQQLLVAARPMTVRSAEPSTTVEAPLVISIGEVPFSDSEAGARAASLNLFRAAADRLCRFAAANAHDALAGTLASPQASQFACEHFDDGFKCMLSSSYRCQIRENRILQVCG